jgi:Holliday junction resolvase-like predicted endonuclease
MIAMKYTNTQKDYFYNCLKTAKIGEEIVADILQNKGYTVRDVSNDKDWFESDIDLLVYQNDKLVHTIEVKTDEKALATGNVFIETKSNQGLGWIWKTEADYIYIVIPNQKIYVLFRDEFVAWFRNIMHECKLRSAKTTDKNGNLLYYTWGRLIPMTVIENLEFVYSIPIN